MILDDEDILMQAATDSAHYEMVDLGLSVKWANKNVGASHPEDAGLYFQWGVTIGYTADQAGKDKVFDKYSYPEHLNIKYNSTNGLKVLESEDDAATVYMGSSYRMPTVDEIRELINNTTQTFIDIDGNEYVKGVDNINIEQRKLKGVRFTSSNSNSIFIPAVGYCRNSMSMLYGVNMYGILWSSSLSDEYYEIAKYLSFSYVGNLISGSDNRSLGLSIRGVEKITNKL